jgi:ABC-type uncharacterized transport system permease subunit
MLQLPIMEKNVFIAVLVIFLVSSVLSVRQLFKSGEKYRRMLISMVALAVTLQSVILVFRAVDIKAIPLTGLFESMIVLSIAFGLTFLFLSAVIRQVWFSSIMIWFLFGLILLSAFVATPAAELHYAAKTPWVFFHALTMVLSGAAIVMSAALASLFLITRRNLKQKNIGKVLGKMPNIEKLEDLNVLGIKTAFAFLTFGLVSGIGLAMVSGGNSMANIANWLTDSKIVMVIVAWALLAVVLVLRHLLSLRGRAIARLTLIACFMIVFAIVGSTIFCSTGHVFTESQQPAVDNGGQQ